MPDLETSMFLFIVVFCVLAVLALLSEILVSRARKRLDKKMADARRRCTVAVLYTNCSARTIIDRREFLDKQCVNPARAKLGEMTDARELCKGCPNWSAERIRRVVEN